MVAGNSLRNDVNDKRVFEASVGEVIGSVVEDEVDASQLLEGLKEASRHQALADGTLETIDVASFCDAHLVSMVGLNFCQLFDQCWVSGIEATEPAERLGRLLVLVLLDQESWSLRQEEQAGADDD